MTFNISYKPARAAARLLLAACVLAVAAAVLAPLVEARVQGSDADLRRRLQAANRLRVVGRYGEAAEFYRKLYEDYPQSEAVVREYGETLLLNKDYAEAEALYLAIRERDGRPLAYAVQLERIHKLQGRYREAVGDCLDVLAANRARIDWVRGELADIAGGAEDGMDLVMEVIEARAGENPRFGEYRMLGVEMLVRAARPEEAADMLEALRGDEDISAENLRELGVQLDALGERALAVQALEMALRRQGGVSAIAGSAFELSKLLAEAGRSVESRQVLLDLAERYPNSAIAFKAHLMVATLESEALGRPEAALDLYRDLLGQRKLPVDAGEVKAAMGKCLLKLGRLSEARETYAGLAEDPSAPNPEAEFMAAEVSFFMGETDSALALYSNLATQHPDWELANDAIDRVFLLQENAGAGGVWLSFGPGRDEAPADSAVEAEPDLGNPRSDPLSLFAAAELLAAIGRPDSALAYLEAIVTVHGDGPLVDDAVFRASDHYLSLGQVDRAMAGLSRVAEEHSGGRLAALARERLGDIWWKEKGDGRRALEEYTKGLDEYPNSLVAPRVRDKVARLRREAG